MELDHINRIVAAILAAPVTAGGKGGFGGAPTEVNAMNAVMFYSQCLTLIRNAQNQGSPNH